jgi:hypothetical protein
MEEVINNINTILFKPSIETIHIDLEQSSHKRLGYSTEDQLVMSQML